MNEQIVQPLVNRAEAAMPGDVISGTIIANVGRTATVDFIHTSPETGESVVSTMSIDTSQPEVVVEGRNLHIFPKPSTYHLKKRS